MATTSSAQSKNRPEGMIEWTRRDALLGALEAIEKSPSYGTGECAEVRDPAEVRGRQDERQRRRLARYVLENFMKVVRGEDENAMAYFAGNMSRGSEVIGSGGTARVLQYAKRIWARHPAIEIVKPSRRQDVFKPATKTAKKPAQPAKKPTQTPQKKPPTPQLDQAIDLVDNLAKLPVPAGVKAGLDTIKSSLKLAKTAKQQGDTPTYTKHIASLADAIFRTIGEIVKWAGQNAALAADAASQLGKIAKWFGGAAKALGAINNLSKVIRGKSLGGTVVDDGERVDAALDLITTFTGTVGLAASLSLNAYKWMWNTIGVPILEATRQAGENDLRYIFNDKSPTQLKSEISAMPTDVRRASSTIRKLYGDTFTRSSLFNTGYSATHQWMKFRDQRVGKYQNEINDVYLEDSWASNRKAPTTPAIRTQIAQELKRAAIAFIDQEVGKVRKR